MSTGGLVLRRASGAAVKLDADALRQMLAYRQRGRLSREAGGVLLGRHIIGSSDVVVDEITVPMRGDRRARHAFQRGQVGHQQAIDFRWENSHGTCNYLGEWHTHTETTPRPSPTDLLDWKRHLAIDRVDADFLLFMIVGRVDVLGWEGSRRTGLVQPLFVDSPEVRCGPTEARPGVPTRRGT